jgi:ABC-type antimicrobial peptide transport system permease subunit
MSSISYVTFDEVRRRTELSDGALAMTRLGRSTLTIDGETLSVDSQFVSDDYFSTLRVQALLGRTLTPADDLVGGGIEGPVAVISYRLWQQRFGGAVSVIGRPVTVERVPVTIVGVLPPAFFGTEVGRAFGIAVPINTQPLLSPSTPATPDWVWLTITLRLRPGQSIEAATAALRAVQPQIRGAAMPKESETTDFLKDPFRIDPTGASTSALRQRFQRPLTTIFAVVVLVLVIASANIANLMLARGAARWHELSVRLALGASRWRLARQFLAESVVLAGIGACVGLAFAAWASRALVAQLSTSVTQVVLDLTLDWRVLAFTTATMVATALLLVSRQPFARRAFHLSMRSGTEAGVSAEAGPRVVWPVASS